jgi:DNA polymerase-1
MIRIDAALQGMQSALLLQVHDELVLECPADELDAVKDIVKVEMESVRQLKVPLVAGVGVGLNWRDAK